MHRRAWLGSFLYDKPKVKHPVLYAAVSFAHNAASCLCLCSAVALMIGRFFLL
jgi:hypothetical protein